MARYLTVILDEENLLLAVTGIKISLDQSYAWITINTLGSTEEKQELVDFLNHNKAGIRSELAGYMNGRRVP